MLFFFLILLCLPLAVSRVEEHQPQEEESTHECESVGVVRVRRRDEPFKLVVPKRPDGHLLCVVDVREALPPVIDDNLKGAVRVGNPKGSAEVALAIVAEARADIRVEHRPLELNVISLEGDPLWKKDEEEEEEEVKKKN